MTDFRLLYMRTTLLLLTIVLVAGCSKAEPLPAEPTGISPMDGETSAPLPTGDAALGVVELVVRDLAFQLRRELNTIRVASVESVEWPNSGLGCPLPGADYAQMLTPGYRITLQVGDQVYTYHTDRAQTLVLCQDGLPQLPNIPVIPGEIQDGEPWMPVDPVPTVSVGDTIADPDPIR